MHVGNYISRNNNTVLHHKIFGSTWLPFLERINISQIISVLNLFIFQFQLKVCVQYIHKYIALYHKLTNKIPKEQTQVMKHTQNTDKLIILPNRDLNS
jgi:hypothetical protein